MTRKNQIPLILEILQQNDYVLMCQFSNGRIKLFDFEELLVQWDFAENTPGFKLNQLENFKQVELHDGVLTWPNLTSNMKDWEGIEQFYPFDLDPVVLYKSGEFLHDGPISFSVQKLLKKLQPKKVAEEKLALVNYPITA